MSSFIRDAVSPLQNTTYTIIPSAPRKNGHMLRLAGRMLPRRRLNFDNIVIETPGVMEVRKALKAVEVYDLD